MKSKTLVITLLLLVIAQTRAETAKSSEHFAMLQDVRVHYSNYGAGDFALVLVHGWNCDERVWKNQVATLSAKVRVLTVDLPGHGKSDKPEMSYNMDLHARALAAVMQDAGVTSAVLVGHSNGTPVVRQFYRLFPEKTRGLVIVDGALRPFGDQALMEKFIAPLRGRDYEQTAGRFVSSMLAPVKDAKEREELREMMLAGPQNVAVSEMESLMDPALWKQDKIEVPVLMILAKQPAWTPEYEEFARGLCPALDYQIWEDVSHFLMLDKPQEFNAAVLRFLKQHQLLK